MRNGVCQREKDPGTDLRISPWMCLGKPTLAELLLLLQMLIINNWQRQELLRMIWPLTHRENSEHHSQKATLSKCKGANLAFSISAVGFRVKQT